MPVVCWRLTAPLVSPFLLPPFPHLISHFSSLPLTSALGAHSLLSWSQGIHSQDTPISPFNLRPPLRPRHSLLHAE